MEGPDDALGGRVDNPEPRVVARLAAATQQRHLCLRRRGVEAFVVAHPPEVVLVPGVHTGAIDPRHAPYHRDALASEFEARVPRLQVAERVVPLGPDVDVARGRLQLERLGAQAKA